MRWNGILVLASHIAARLHMTDGRFTYYAPIYVRLPALVDLAMVMHRDRDLTSYVKLDFGAPGLYSQCHFSRLTVRTNP